MFDILCLGEALVELNQAAPGGSYAIGFGGDTSNVAIAAARCGARSAYFTIVGGDNFGQALLDLWVREGVEARCVKANGGAHTGIYFVTHTQAGHEFSYMRAGSAASRMSEADLPVDIIRDARVLLVSAISQAISSSAADAVFEAIAIARAAGKLVAYDTNLRLKLWPLTRARAIIHEAMRSIDIALPSMDDATQLTGLGDAGAILDYYLRLGAKIVALKMGARGACVATPARRETIAPLRVAAIDATGAGDAFDGAFLSEFLRGDDPFAAARFANAAAALSTRGLGAVAPLPTRAAVIAALAGATPR